MAPTALTGWLEQLAAQIKSTKPDDPLNVVRGYPIPCFGNVSKARVVTVGVNPSGTEFSGNRS